MADKSEEEGEIPQSFEENSTQNNLDRPVSGKSGGSSGSKKSITATVGQLTAKALREFRLSDEGTNVSESGAGDMESVHTHVPGASEEQNEGVEGETLLENDEEYELQEENEGDDVEFDENVNVMNEDDLVSSGEEDSDGDNDLVVLDPDHVSSLIMLTFSPRIGSSLFRVK